MVSCVNTPFAGGYLLYSLILPAPHIAHPRGFCAGTPFAEQQLPPGSGAKKHHAFHFT